ncbi:hypothetical protein LCGC14_2144500 [marine sediment metagenome]|uniref:Uncharacterized protein n=1 Tax=marine sediment metagenome TaxID=412755 RepID=A0A0F9GAD8_9ZZZZ
MNILFKLFNVLALSADLDVEEVPPLEVLNILAGTADTLYKGAIVHVGTDGFIAVAADTTACFAVGIMKKQVVAAGSNAEACEILTGRFWLAMSIAAQSHVGQLIYATADNTITPTATSNTGALGMCVGFKTGFVLVDTRIRNLVIGD